MAMRELGKLENVRITDIWPHEEHNFTKWMAQDLSHLNAAVGMQLRLIEREYRTEERGRVDILAEDTKSGGKVVIENQIYASDDDHFLRLIGYAASTEAKSIIWVAKDFHDSHIKMLRWLTVSGVEAFGVKISAVKIGEAYAPLFDVVVSPEQAADHADESTSKGPNIYARFYRPLTATLRIEGIYAMGGRQGGWTGRFRRYRFGVVSENSGMALYSVLGMSGRLCEVGLHLTGENQTRIYDALFADRDELEKAMSQFDITWQQDERASYVSTQGGAIADHEEKSLEDARNWMKDALMTFQAVFQPAVVEIDGSLEQ